MFNDRYWLQDELLRTFTDGLFARPSRRAANVFPPVNLSDDGANYFLRAELPGVSKESLNVTVKGDQLTLEGKRDVRVASASYHRRERDGGTFSRTLTLPEAIDGERIEATYKNGVLEVRLPRQPRAQPRRVEIH
jgi:HSP20 family protein